MASSPALQSRYAHSPLTRKRDGAGHFGETSSRTMIGLQKVNVQLQKEMDKLDKQAHTAVTNIANHQQAMKMSWRRLEQKRNSESPLLSRTRKHAHADSPSPSERRGMLSSNTRLYVPATPNIYHPRERGIEKEEDSGGNSGRGREEALPSGGPSVASEAAVALHPAVHLLKPPPITNSYLRSSPYLSSPYTVRRPTPLLQATKDHPFTSAKGDIGTVLGGSGGGGSGGGGSGGGGSGGGGSGGGGSGDGGREVNGEGEMGVSVRGGKGGSAEERSSSVSELKLPPIHSPSQSMLMTHSGTTDKDTLMKASQLMGLDAHSQGPHTFKSFYGDRPPSRSIVLSTPVQTPVGGGPRKRLGARGGQSTEQWSREGVQEVSSEPSLAELFEQIRHCRYIRHYHPDGTALEDIY